LIGYWDHIDVGADDNVFWALKKVDGFDIVVFRGSITAIDWFNDFRALPILTRVGHVHAGFFSGIERVWSEVRPLLTQPVIVTGHSLGAARAGVLTALMVADGAAPVARVVFGEPKPGLIDFAKIVADVPARSYRNGNSKDHDLVTDIPATLPPIQFVHPTPIVVVDAEPTGGLFETLGIFAYHHCPLYVAGVTALTEGSKP
jgi:hypothetical protein